MTERHIVRCFKVGLCLYYLRLMTNDAASSSACLRERTASVCEDKSWPYLFVGCGIHDLRLRHQESVEARWITLGM